MLFLRAAFDLKTQCGQATFSGCLSSHCLKKKKSYGDRETSEWAHKVPLVDTHFLPVIQLTTVLGTAVNFTDVIKVPNQLTLREGMDPVASELVT